MKLYLHCGLVVIHSNRLSDKGQGQKVQEKGETGQDKTQGTVRPEIKEAVKNPKERFTSEEQKINMCSEDKRRLILSREEGIDFYPQ